MQIIAVKEERDSNEFKWKQTLRQLQEECTDLKYLLDSKDQRIKKLDAEVTKLKMGMQNALEKIYLPSQDQIVEGLSYFNERQSTNLVQGHEQTMELTSTVQKTTTEGQYSTAVGGSSNAVHQGLHYQETMMVDQNQWAMEMRKADERCEQFSHIIEELQMKLSDEEHYTEELKHKIKIRDEEILRLHDLYTPA